MSFKCDKVRLSKEILYLFYQKKNKAARRLFYCGHAWFIEHKGCKYHAILVVAVCHSEECMFKDIQLYGQRYTDKKSPFRVQSKKIFRKNW